MTVTHNATPIMTRKQAQELGLVKFDYLACRKCGCIQRYAISGHCVQCANATSTKWREENHDKFREMQNTWHDENRIYVNQYKAAWRRKQRELAA